MSQETVDQIRRSYETFNRRDWEAFRRMMDPEIVVESRLVAMDAGYRARGVGHGASSGTPVDDPFWHALESTDGRCTWWRNCSTEVEALEAIAERSGGNPG